MFLSLGVEHDDATVIEVEADGDALVVLDAVPVGRMAVDVVKHHYRTFVALLEQPLIVGFHRHKCQIYVDSLIAEPCLATSRLQIIMEAHPVDDGLGLHLVGYPEIEQSQFAAQPVVAFSQLGIGIIRPMLVDDVSDKPIVGRRLDAETSAMPDSPKPDESLLESVHIPQTAIMMQKYEIIMNSDEEL